MSPRRRFCIYYGDRTTYSDRSPEHQGDPYYAPGTNVQVIVIEEPAAALGFITVKPRDAYFYKDGRFWHCDNTGKDDYLMHHMGPQKVLFGRTIETEEYKKIFARAKREGLGGV